MGDKVTLANPAWLKECIEKIIRGEFGGIYEVERGITEVRFNDQFEPVKSRIPTANVEIDGFPGLEIPRREHFPSHNFCVA